MAKVNPWLQKKIPEAAPRASPLRYIVEVAPRTREQVKAQLRPIANLDIVSQPADRYIVVSAPAEAIPRIETIPEVVKIHGETLAWIKRPIPVLGIPTPLETFKLPSRFDPYLGEVKLSRVEIPVSPAQALAMGPLRSIKGVVANKMRRYTTVDQREYIGAPADNKIGIKCAVADTGLGLIPHLIHPNTQVELTSKVPGELAYDLCGHGSWCTAAAFGDNATHPLWGKCDGIADPEIIVHLKCLSNLGFGMTSWILDAIYDAWKRGCKVLSMSLGGPQQGSALDDDPTCRLISSLKDEMIVVVAAGNDGVEWSIGSPGVAPDALTVGAWSMTDNARSWFSSMGPSGEFYRDNPEAWSGDLYRVGDDLIKPDICAPGGGRKHEGDDDEQILSGCSGWFDPYGDILPGWAFMKGSSMATPAAAGAVAILYDRGIIKTAADVKRVMAGVKSKDAETGYGLFHFRHFGF